MMDALPAWHRSHPGWHQTLARCRGSGGRLVEPLALRPREDRSSSWLLINPLHKGTKGTAALSQHLQKLPKARKNITPLTARLFNSHQFSIWFITHNVTALLCNDKQLWWHWSAMTGSWDGTALRWQAAVMALLYDDKQLWWHCSTMIGSWDGTALRWQAAVMALLCNDK